MELLELMANMMMAQELPKISEVVKKGNEFFLVDTCYTPDHGWETMVFECDESGEVENWSDLDCEIYDSEEEARTGHSEMVKRWAA